ncbi:uncharacterized protein BdWA1_003645 [Babesia duncani]|nr:hypothetical protein BdWA1_003645 [Babesia duncani]
MEILYPFLFANKNNESSCPSMLLKNESCLLKRRVVATILFVMASMAPDAYLLIMNTLRPLRLYAIVNFVKIICGMIAVGFFGMAFIIRVYMDAALDPKRLGDRATLSFLKNNATVNVSDYYPKTGWELPKGITSTQHFQQDLQYLPVHCYQDLINARIRSTLKTLQEDADSKLDKDNNIFQRVFKKNGNFTFGELQQRNILFYSYTRNSFDHAKKALEMFANVNLLIAITTLAAGFLAFSLCMKRHKFMAIGNCILESVVIVTHACYITFLQFPLDGTKLYCNTQSYIPSPQTSFEAMTIFTWMCRMTPMFYSAITLASVLVAVGVVDFILLIVLIV